MKTHTSNAQHTPGPWSHTPGQDTIWANDGDLLIARTEYTRGEMRVNEDDANARLIAAAPALLEALRAMIAADTAICENVGLKSDQAMQRIAALDAAERAIASATSNL